MPNAEDDDPGDEQFQQQDGAGQQPCFTAPARERGIHGGSGSDDERVMGAGLRRDQPLPAVKQALLMDDAAIDHRDGSPIRLGFITVLATGRFDAGIARQKTAIASP